IQLLFIMLLISSKAYPLHRECSKTHARTGACVRHRVIAEESDIKVLHHKIDQINDKLKHLENKPHITLEEISAIKAEIEDYVFMVIKKYDEINND
ncbi:MAG: hypothetical protein OEY33_03095, partial [Bdellovibrionales bacterium]|nr:hypothetical protein [Bdellovibrionales bacterium]